MVKALTENETCATRTRDRPEKLKMAKKDKSSESGERPDTEVVHLGRKPFEQHGFVNTPVYRGSTVLYPTLDAIKKRTQPFTYRRRPMRLKRQSRISKAARQRF